MDLNKIYNEKCEATLKRMPDNFIDLTITSPPYDEIRKYKGFAFDADLIISELFRSTKEGGVCVWVVGDQTKNGSESGSSFRQALKFIEHGWKLYDTMIYRKKNYMTTNHRRYEQEFEYMFVFSKGMPKTFNPIKVDCVKYGVEQIWRETGERKVYAPRGKRITTKSEKTKGNIWEYACGLNGTTKDKIAFEHPAVFPENLAADHVRSWSNENDLIYDCFMGSGTTAKVAAVMNRNFIGSEISQEYVEIANKRLQPYLNTLFKSPIGLSGSERKIIKTA